MLLRNDAARGGNLYCYGLKIPGPQIQRFKKATLQTSKLSIFQVMEKFRNGLQQCMINRAHHLEDVILKTTSSPLFKQTMNYFVNISYPCLFLNL